MLSAKITQRKEPASFVSALKIWPIVYLDGTKTQGIFSGGRALSWACDDLAALLSNTRPFRAEIIDLVFFELIFKRFKPVLFFVFHLAS